MTVAEDRLAVSVVTGFLGIDQALVADRCRLTKTTAEQLRVKRLCNVIDLQKPVVMHGVQQIFHPPA